MRVPLLLSFFSFLMLPVFSQECEVLITSIHGKYTGGCKNSKADGQGKAEGEDSFEGNFKGGYPNGDGIYTYKNGDFFIGTFKKGLKDGKGEFHYKKAESADSTIRGFWKNDVYKGEYLYPYIIEQQTSRFTRLEVKPDVGIANTLTIVSQNVIKSNSLMTNTPPPLPVITQFSVDQGSFEREERSSTDKISTLILYGLKFPVHLHVIYEDDSFEILISKPGTWRIQAQLALTTN